MQVRLFMREQVSSVGGEVLCEERARRINLPLRLSQTYHLRNVFLVERDATRKTPPACVSPQLAKARKVGSLIQA